MNRCLMTQCILCNIMVVVQLWAMPLPAFSAPQGPQPAMSIKLDIPAPENSKHFPSSSPPPVGLTIDADYPGGNIIVDKIENDTVYIRPDLRDTQGWWFYWNFRVRGAKNRTLTFKFTTGNAIGVKGPAFSTDKGGTWAWLGTKTVQDASFSYRFCDDADEVRFCLAVPYQQADLDRFLERHKDNPNLSVEELCKTRKGRTICRLHLGRLDDLPQHRILITVRHHACEMMASYVLEGILEEILARTDTGRWFRKNVEVLAVPFMDKDGVENGDQGKNRRPRDHNRDYVGSSIYPSVAALREFVCRWSENKLTVAIDLHCPWIRGPRNEIIYLVGSRCPAVWQQQCKFAQILQAVRTGPLIYKASDDLPFGKEWNTGKNYDSGKSFSRWAAELKGVQLATGIEFPYANVSGGATTPDNARAFGRDLTRAIKKYLQVNICYTTGVGAQAVP